MCGICGIALADPGRAIPRGLIERMCDTIRHRGPDDSGIYLNGAISLGHRRLSIVDLATGHQPMENEDGSVVIAFNGEIYNHADLRPGLEARGHRFRTRSDTEAIVHAYEEAGPSCAGQLRGMFAFALWDARRGQLVLARDHTGIKPIYYALTESGDLVFGSEIKALCASGLVDPAVDESALPEYLAAGHVAGQRTLVRGVRKLLPGHWLTWQAGRVNVEPYWRLPSADPGAGSNAEGDLAAIGEEFWSRLLDSVRSQLMSDVPLGAFLSGGLDSSLLVAAMRELGVGQANSFSVGYAEANANELPWARIAAKAFGTRHHEVLLDAERFFGLLPALTWHRDQPLTFSASIPLHAVSALAAEHVKVVLTGEGCDELFAGYGRYPRALLNLRGGRLLDTLLPGPVRRAVAVLAKVAGHGWLGSRISRSFLAQPGTVAGAYLEAFADVPADLRAELLGSGAERGEWAGALEFLDAEMVQSNPLESLLRLDQATYLEELLMKQDTMSMASSIESRVPFLDHHLVEWASSLPANLKLRGTSGKALVRAAAARRLPPELLGGPKRGFLVPLGGWFRSGAGRRMIEETMLGPGGPSVLDTGAMRRVWLRHQAGGDETPRLWRLLALRLWLVDTLPRLAALARTGRTQWGSA